MRRVLVCGLGVRYRTDTTLAKALAIAMYLHERVTNWYSVFANMALATVFF